MRSGSAVSRVDIVYRDIVAAIEAGAMIAGQRLEPVRAAAMARSVSRETILRAYDKLIAAGMVYAVRGSGFYVGNHSPSAAPVERSVRKRDRSGELDSTLLIHSDHSADFRPGSGTLQHDPASQAELARVVRGVIASGSGLADTYGDPLGYVPLREKLREQLRTGGVVAPMENVMTAHGALAAVNLAVRALLRPGDPVLAEDPCSFMHISALLAQGADILRVPRAPDGPDLNVVAELCSRYRPKMFLLSSQLHNPTGTSISLHKAQRLIEIAAEHDVVLVDDCSYSDLLPPASMSASVPLIKLDRLRCVVHVGGFSRTLGAVMGPGFVVGGEEQMRYIRLYRLASGIGNAILSERALYRMLNEGLYRRRCERLRTRLAADRVAVKQWFSERSMEGSLESGGMFIWQKLGTKVDATVVARRMLSHGYLTAPAEHFSSSAPWRSYMRFNVTTTTRAACEALERCLSDPGK